MVGSLSEATFLGSIKGNEECTYAHALIDDYIIQGADKKNCSIGEEYSKHVQGCCHRDGIYVVTCWKCFT